MKWLYVVIDLSTIAVPLLFSFHPKLRFHKNFKYFFPANFLTASIFIAWDVLFTNAGVWGFNPNYVTGFFFLNLPIEEVLFFVCIPYACAFTYHCLNIFFVLKWKAKTEQIFTLGSAVILLLVGIYFHAKSYTAVTFISLACLLVLFKYGYKINWLPKLVLIYPLLLVPFFIVNGILTGSGLESPVVWYNNEENMNFRIFTIPFEDLFYGFELVLLNIFFYEKLLQKQVVK